MKRKPGTLLPIEVSILEAAAQLRQLGAGEFHGFQIAKKIKDQKEARLLTGYGTLYRALERLEKQGFLSSRWEDPLAAAEQNRPRRRLYKLTGVAATVPSHSAPDGALVALALRRSPS